MRESESLEPQTEFDERKQGGETLGVCRKSGDRRRHCPDPLLSLTMSDCEGPPTGEQRKMCVFLLKTDLQLVPMCL